MSSPFAHQTLRGQALWGPPIPPGDPAVPPWCRPPAAVPSRSRRRAPPPYVTPFRKILYVSRQGVKLISLGQSEGSLHPSGGTQLFICLLNIHEDGPDDVRHNAQPKMDNLSPGLSSRCEQVTMRSPPPRGEPDVGALLCSPAIRTPAGNGAVQVSRGSSGGAKCQRSRAGPTQSLRAAQDTSCAVSWALGSGSDTSAFLSSTDRGHLGSLGSQFLPLLRTGHLRDERCGRAGRQRVWAHAWLCCQDTCPSGAQLCLILLRGMHVPSEGRQTLQQIANAP